jgi:hypothetical protein
MDALTVRPPIHTSVLPFGLVGGSGHGGLQRAGKTRDVQVAAPHAAFGIVSTWRRAVEYQFPDLTRVESTGLEAKRNRTGDVRRRHTGASFAY